jgi:hypothetical protein
MAGPDTLNDHGNNVTYPTWIWPRTTQLFVQSLDQNNYGRVTVGAGDATEDVSADPGGPTSITRSWAGIEINVTNSRSDMDVPVQVWTE